MYRLFRFLFLIIFKVLHRFEVRGAEHIPETGPAILVSNHVSNWDPMVLGCSAKRQVHFIAKESLFKTPVIGILMKAWGCLPVKRGRGDREAIAKSLEILANRMMLGVFIEGTRNKENPEQMKTPQSGAAMLALKSGAPVVPLVLLNTRKIGTGFAKVKVIIGAPLHFEFQPGLDKKELYHAVSNQMVAAIENLRQRA